MATARGETRACCLNLNQLASTKPGAIHYSIDNLVLKQMLINNDRVWAAAKALAEGPDDVRMRVAVACSILEKLARQELNSFDARIKQAIDELLSDAGKLGPTRNAVTGDVIVDKYRHTARLRHKKTYVKHAESIFKINENINNAR